VELIFSSKFPERKKERKEGRKEGRKNVDFAKGSHPVLMTPFPSRPK